MLSKAASISSSTKNGADWTLWMAKRNARAAIVFLDMGWNLLLETTQL